MINFKPLNRKMSAKSRNFSFKDFCAFAGFCAFAVLFLSSCATAHTHFMRNIDFEILKDGTYMGKATTLLGNVKLATTIKDGKITDIKILSRPLTYPLAGRAYNIIPKRIIEKQSLDVDAVTAATVSSNNIKRAVFNALDKAR